MTTKLETRLITAKNPTENSSPTTGTVGEGVKAVAIFESRQARGKRAWDEMSEIDRAVLLESVRQRRIQQKRKRSIESSIYNMRSGR